MKIAQKLILGFLVVAIIAAIVGVIGIINNSTINAGATEMYQKETLGLQYTGSAAVSFQQIRYDMIKLNSVKIDDKDTMKPLVDDISAQSDKIKILLSQSEEAITKGETADILTKIETEWAQYQTEMPKILDDYLNSDGTYAKSKIADVGKLGTAIRDDYLSLFEKLSSLAGEQAKTNVVSSRNAIIVMIVIIVLAVVIAIMLGAYISKSIAQPLRKMAAVGKLLSVGDIGVEQVLEGKDYELKKQKDEIGDLAAAFNGLIGTTKAQAEAIHRLAEGDLTIEFKAASDKDLVGNGLVVLTENLNNLMSSIITASDQVMSGASMVSHSSMALSQGATEQASSVEELTASVDEIATQTNTNAENAKKASTLAHDARENASAGNGQMKEMLRAMEEISASSSNINKIIKVIDDIAFQTNILALNAAVEAARAGQHGKGFAVVAEEVRTLAARSANAANETTDLIENSIKKVETGTKIANETAGALRQIVDQVDKAAELVGSIATASSEQAIAVEEINQGIVQVSQVVQTNAATAEESAAASEELSAQAEQLKELVSVFKVKKLAYTRERPSGQPAGKSTGSAAVNKTRLLLGDSDMGKY
jgi:methyl-accepting chemotaxis protein